VDHAELLKSLSGYDVVILPSIWPENQSTVLLEAMASGAAQIATALGGNAELVGTESPDSLSCRGIHLP